jgi:hypothetical protein
MTSSQRQDDFEMDDGGLISNTIADIIFDPKLLRAREARAQAIANATANSAANGAPETVAPDVLEVSAQRKRKRRRTAARKPKHQAAPPRESALERHQRKCVICSHAERETIDEQFLNWHSPMRIAIHYDLEVRGLFRHAHATGLYTSRQANLRSALDRVLERADQANISADGIVRTVRAYTCLTRDNRWVEPPTRVIFSSTPASPLVVAAPSAQNALNPPLELPAASQRSNSADLSAQILSSNLLDLISSD